MITAGTTDESRRAFVVSHTTIEPVPLAREIRLHTATDVVPLWSATETWLCERGLAVPFWCVPWAGGQVLARWLLDRPELVRGKRVLDFGTGSGLVAIAAALSGATHVRGVDVDPNAIAAAGLNAALNGVTIDLECADIVDSVVTEDVVFGGDIWYENGPSSRFARWLREVAEKGTRVFTGDPGRNYLPPGLRELYAHAVVTPVELESQKMKRARVLEFAV